MTQTPLISIITPCYNAASYLKDAMDSVLGQTYPHFEWILVNDGSTDATETIIGDCKDTRIRYYRQENKGQCVASNFGLSMASGDYIKFFDADDIMNPSHIESQLLRILGCSNAVASCAWGRFYDNKPESAIFTPESVWCDLPSLEWMKKSLEQPYDMMPAWLWLLPVELIRSSGGWDERLTLNNDFEFSMRILSKVKEVRFAPEAHMYYRTNLHSLSGTREYTHLKAAILSTELGCKHLMEIENSDLTRRLCADRFQEWLFRIYPEYPDLQNQVISFIQMYGGSKRKMDGGFFFRFISDIFGWRFTKKLKIWLQPFRGI